MTKVLLKTMPELVNARDQDGRMPLHLAAFNGFTDMVVPCWHF